MIDLHTHILPQIDDGPDSCETSIEMLRQQYAMGVDTVALTPHYYYKKESIGDFLQRRSKSCEMLYEAIEKRPSDAPQLPKLMLGAEVAWTLGLRDADDLDRLCYEGTKFMLLELPFTAWDNEMLRQICDLQNMCGVTPVIAHFERYFPFQSQKKLREVQELGLPIQIGSDSFLQFGIRGRMMKMLKYNQAHIVASDCHNLEGRKPNLLSAVQIIEKKLGTQTVQLLDKQAHDLLRL